MPASHGPVKGGGTGRAFQSRFLMRVMLAFLAGLAIGFVVGVLIGFAFEAVLNQLPIAVRWCGGCNLGA